MDLIFPHDKSVEISFKVGIAGTAAAAQSVYVSLSKDGTTTSFSAYKDGEEYKALIEYPSYLLGFGNVDFSINVKVNDRIFSPFKSTALLMEPQAPEQIVNVEQDTVEEVPTVSDKPAADLPPVRQITAKDLQFESKPARPKQAEKSLMKMIEPIQPKILKPKVKESLESAPSFSVKKLKVIFK